MSEIIEDFYNNKQFSKTRKLFESQGKSKEQIFEILKEKLINMDTYQSDIETLLKKRIDILLKEKFGSDISEPILEVFKEKYQCNISDLDKNISIVRAVCLEEGVLFEELIASTLKNIEDKISDAANFFIKNERDILFSKNKESFLNYFQENSDKIDEFSKITNMSSSDIKKILERLQKLEERINTNLKSNVQLINRISDENSLKNIKNSFNDEFKNHYDLICKKEINHISSIQTVLESKYDSLKSKYDSLKSKYDSLKSKYDSLESNMKNKNNDDLMKRIIKLEKNKTEFSKEKDAMYNMIIHNTNQMFTTILNKEKQNQFNKNNEFEKKINNINKKIDDLQINHNRTKQGLNEKFKLLDIVIKKNNEKINSLIENIQITLKSISKKDVEKDINIKNEIEKFIEDKFEQSKKCTHSSQDDINLKEDLYKIRGDINVLFNKLFAVNMPYQHSVQQFYPHYQ